jgi:hypothetical protein
VPLSNFAPRGFGFVHHSIAILYHQVPNLSITIRNFFIAVLQEASPLHIAAATGMLEPAKVLLEYKAEVNLASPKTAGNSPLHFAVGYGHPEVRPTRLRTLALCPVENSRLSAVATWGVNRTGTALR